MISLKLSNLIVGIIGVVSISVVSTVWMVNQNRVADSFLESSEVDRQIGTLPKTDGYSSLKPDSQNSPISIKNDQELGAKSGKIVIFKNEVGLANLPASAKIYDQKLPEEKFQAAVAALMPDGPIYSTPLTEEQQREADELINRSLPELEVKE